MFLIILVHALTFSVFSSSLSHHNAPGGVAKLDQPLQLSTSFREMLKYRQAKTKSIPFSSDFWPDIAGNIAARYRDPLFKNADRVQDPGNRVYNTILKHYANKPTPKYMKQHGIEKLSPAEKYDLLVGDTSFTLTNSTLRRGERAYLRFRKNIRPWYGICNGLANASIAEKNPKKTVWAKNKNGLRIPFYPNDIRALAAKMYDVPGQKLIGRNCSESNLSFNHYGTPQKTVCKDLNPVRFHQVLIASIAKKRESFIFDESANSDIWNYPVSAYTAHFRNPVNNRTDQIKARRFEVGNSQNYPYLINESTVSPLAEFIVRVKLTVTHGRTSNLLFSHNITSELSTHSVYEYDLELAADGETVVGGNWLGSPAHKGGYIVAWPDFIWTKNTKKDVALTAQDNHLKGHDLKSIIAQENLISLSRQAAQTKLVPAQQGGHLDIGARPLAKVVRALINQSAR